MREASFEAFEGKLSWVDLEKKVAPNLIKMKAIAL